DIHDHNVKRMLNRRGEITALNGVIRQREWSIHAQFRLGRVERLEEDVISDTAAETHPEQLFPVGALGRALTGHRHREYRLSGSRRSERHEEHQRGKNRDKAHLELHCLFSPWNETKNE